ncbi:MAG: glycoside hydrolase family 88 protein [Planctomycetaceae bacterium]|nr:glycoside hydrolase family 88 protein [Planctomycetaceae bacterium]
MMLTRRTLLGLLSSLALPRTLFAAEPLAPDLVSAARRIARRFMAENKHERNYRFYLALEALLELSAATGEAEYRQHVLRIIDRRGWKPTTDVSFNEQSFECLTYALYRTSGEQAWLDVFLRQSALCRLKKERSPEGAVMHARGRERGGGYALLLDAMQEYVARMARAGKHSDDATYFTEAARQIRLYRQIVRDESTGLWHQGRGWLGDAPERVSPGVWSRGHGWLLRGLSTAVIATPRERPEFTELRAVFVELAEALIARQQPSGMWHCLLEQPPDKTPAESSGTAMIATALSRVWRAGITTDPRHREAVEKAFRALPAFVDSDGRALSTSPGPGPLESEANYFTNSFPPGNDHGTFALMFAAAEAVAFDKFVATQ